ncbi:MULTISPECIES: hypothetical protein [unclassified Streptomyces]|uniref:hypothetical protein n=1 Tax=unclassified Streptomyces TaxID=2593676 RepID=UPI002E1072CB|nr:MULTISPECIES: hypothetical protein [unclassified Streptomyces]WSR27417.1 hypothetical protein OG573_15555 [Streptomyces sp. NBC_01205]
MSPVAMGGPALFIGTETAYVAVVRPRLDPADPEVREAAEQAGVSPEEFAGPGNVWALMWDDESGEGGGFELPGLRDAEAEDFADRLLAELSFESGPFIVGAGEVLRLQAYPGEGGGDCRFLATVTPPEGEELAPLTLEIPPVDADALRAELEDFRRALA